ncbi:ornithine cyclodeaminase family protein [Shinella sp. CPCC 100929]|uniref:Ornithine cyclodeaminase family protein n=1 Tax=Shinella lacus TaxID=2654216 RepID=A0ABT1RBI3_9HYPH|nr:ornithine cyclodeaminase family protein [Shinella lacus]MCQ4632550.1 ornithine cyclodeaminase family protein [Shinella lacus]
MMISLTLDDLKRLPIAAFAVDAIRDAYVAIVDGRANIPPVGYLRLEAQNADCHIKYGYIAGDDVFVVKIASGFYNNPRRGLPSSNGMMIAISSDTGQVVATLYDEGWLTDLRTGFGGAIATLALCRRDSRSIAIVGSGTQARQQIRALSAIAQHPLTFRNWGRDGARAKTFASEMTAEGFSVKAEPDLATLCATADAIITTTPSAAPIVMAEWVRPGTHITALGADAPGKQELHLDLLSRAAVIAVDHRAQCADHGEIATAVAAGLLDPSACPELGAILNGSQPGRTADTQITIADLTGVATQDIAIVRAALQAVKQAST